MHLVVYQPQLRAWQKYQTMVAVTAISVTENGGKPLLGVISWRANTFTNVSTGAVYVKDIQVLAARFPSLDAAQDSKMKERSRQLYPTITFTIGLPRMIASLETVNESMRSIGPNTEVPSIRIATAPAIVLIVTGKPISVPIQGTTLQYVVNTSWNLFFDQSYCYLLTDKTWLKANELRGPWAVTVKLPADMAKMPAHENWDDVLKGVPPRTSAQAAPISLIHGKAAVLVHRNFGPSINDDFQFERLLGRSPTTFSPGLSSWSNKLSQTASNDIRRKQVL